MSSFIDRWRRNYLRVKERDEKWILGVDMLYLQKAMWVLFLVYLALNVLDIVSTLYALSLGPAFFELNPIAAGLFRRGFVGFLFALVLKYVPLVPLGYGVLLREKDGNQVQVRAVKMGILVVLGAADVFYLAVAISNVATLVLSLS